MLVRIALAQLPYPSTPDDALERVLGAMRLASNAGAAVVVFPECYVPGYRGLGHAPPAPDATFLDRAWQRVESAARELHIGAVVGTERATSGRSVASVLVVDADGKRLGFQDKVQIDPSEDATYVPGDARHVFTIGALKFGIVICHEGWRYPETVRWAARHGAQIVFHPHFHEAEPGSYRPTTFADPANTFHEKAALCRAAENTCYFATVNYASAGSPTTSAIVGPDGTLIGYQPYGQEGLLIGDLDLTSATRLLAGRLRA